MTRALRIEYPGAYYHITSRGNERKNIFVNNKDREKYLSYLQSAHLRYGAVIHAFCLMNNHYHLFLETPKGNLSKIMRHINGAYTIYFNIKHKRSGHLFQGRYKAILVEADSYAGELSRYIHLNPVRAGMVDRPEKYTWSSYQYYIGKKKKLDWLTFNFILGFFDHGKLPAERMYQEFINVRIDTNHESPLNSTVASTILGSDHFVESIKNKYMDLQKRDRNVPALRSFRKSDDIEETYGKVKAHFNNALARKATIYIFHKYSDKPLIEIGEFFSIGESGVADISRRLGIVLTKNRKLRKEIELLCNKLNFSSA